MGYISATLAERNMKQTIEFYTNSLGFKMGMAFPDADNPEYADLSNNPKGRVPRDLPVGIYRYSCTITLLVKRVKQIYN